MTITIQTDAYGGQYYTAHTDRSKPRAVIPVEKPDDVDRFVCAYRQEPFFMSAKAGSCVDEIPLETQWLGIRHTDGTYSVYFSMAFETYRTAFHGEDSYLWVTALTGDNAVSAESFCAFYKISGRNFYELVATAARSLRERFDTFSLRPEKETPAFLNDFGWCTWDSFYDQVRSEDISRGLDSFRKGGLVPKLLILDDGWQTTQDQQLSRGQWKLSDFAPNEKFSGDLTETIARAKAFGVEKFFVWHAVLGYWGGVDPKAPKMQKYRPYYHKAVHTDEIRQLNPTRWESEHFDFGMIDHSKAVEFYDDYHASLKQQGVDGVKIDVQSSIEGHGERIALTKAVRSGLENSVEEHFGGNLINCMSCSNDHLYHCKKSNLMRSSNDFFPDDPLSHSKHIYTNAVCSIFMKEFTWCDWDMFQTNHPYGAYHAAARAISGGPVYVSDRVDEHDFGLIRSLTDEECHLLRCNAVAMPTEDCLFRNPLEDSKPYKIFNTNDYGSVVGVFGFSEGSCVDVSPKDIPGCGDGQYVCHRHQTGEFCILSGEESIEISVQKGKFDLVTIAKIVDGFATIGLINKLNCGGAVKKLKKGTDGYELSIAAGGELLFYSARPVTEMTLDGQAVVFCQADGFVTAPLSTGGTVKVKY